jgi:hypothetical protein
MTLGDLLNDVQDTPENQNEDDESVERGTTKIPEPKTKQDRAKEKRMRFREAELRKRREIKKQSKDINR